MDLDSKIESLVGPYWLDDWEGRPNAIYGEKKFKFMEIDKHSPARNRFIRVDKLIESASAAEALTSKYLYVRKAKEWFLKQDYKKNKE